MSVWTRFPGGDVLIRDRLLGGIMGNISGHKLGLQQTYVANIYYTSNHLCLPVNRVFLRAPKLTDTLRCAKGNRPLQQQRDSD
jgi:hypothetical protein